MKKAKVHGNSSGSRQYLLDMWRFQFNYIQGNQEKDFIKKTDVQEY